MFFNVSHKKSGRPGRFYDDAVWAAVSYLRLLAHAVVYPTLGLRIKQLASTKKGTAASQGIRVQRTVNKSTTQGAQDRRCTSGESPDVRL